MMSLPQVVIIDYGMGNLWSVASAVRYLGYEAVVTGHADQVRAAQTLILPGVGSFRLAMTALRERGIEEAILEALAHRKSKILGICLGMQLLAREGTEDGETSGLRLIPGRVDRFSAAEVGTRKIPHVGFNAVRSAPGSRLFQGLPESADFYFVHSYRLLPDGIAAHLATSNYGTEFLAAYERENVFATQFHPEKSQTNGLALLANFLRC